MPNINFIGVVVAAIGSMVVGSLWYGPLFGKKWRALMGMSAEQMGGDKGKMVKTFLIATVGDLLTAYVIAFLIGATFQYFAGISYMLFFWVWLGFAVPMMLGSVLWEGKPWMLFCINAGYRFVSIMTMGAILALPLFS